MKKCSVVALTLCLMVTIMGSSAWACTLPKAKGYDSIDCLKEGLAVVSKDGKYGFINKSGKLVIPLEYGYAQAFSEGLASVQGADGKYGFINKTGKVVIPFKYTGIGSDTEGVHTGSFYKGESMVWLDEQKFCINKAGKRLKKCKYPQ